MITRLMIGVIPVGSLVLCHLALTFLVTDHIGVLVGIAELAHVSS